MTFIYEKASNNYSVYSDANTWAVVNSKPFFTTSPQSAVMPYNIYDISLARANSFYFLVDSTYSYVQFCSTANSNVAYDVANIVVDTAYVDGYPASPYFYATGLDVSNTGSRAIFTYALGPNPPRIVTEAFMSYSPFNITRASGANSWVTLNNNLKNLFINDNAEILFTANTTHITKYVGNALTCTLSYSSQRTVNNDNLDVFFNPTGTRMFTLGATRIYQYNLSTAWDLSTALAGGSYDLSALVANPKCMCFSNDGLYCFVLGGTARKIFRLDLFSSFDISSAVHTGDVTSISIQGYENGLAIKDDGSKLFINTGYSTAEITLSTPYTLSSAGPIANGAPNTYRLRFSYGLAVPNDGYHLFTSSGESVVHKLNMATQWSTGSAYFQEVDRGILTLGPRLSSVYYAKYGDIGRTLYVKGITGSRILQYNLACAYSLVSANYSGQTSIGISGDTFYVTNNRIITGSSSLVRSYILTRDWDITSAVADTANNLSMNASVLAITPNGSEMLTANNSFPYSINKYTLNTANKPNSAYYQRTNMGWLSAGPTSTYIAASKFSHDGKYIFYLEYVAGPGSTSVHKYTLGTNWDLRTAVFTESITLPYTYENLKFSYDGMFMIVNGRSNILSQYQLTAPWTLSGATLKNYVTSAFSAVALNPNGSKLYALLSPFETSKGYLRESTLTDRWNVRSATNNNFVSYIGFSPDTYDIEFSPTGKYMYRVLSNSIIRYTMGTPWDVASIVQDSSYNVPGTSMKINSIYFDTYGNEFIVSDYTHKAIFKFNT